MTARSRRDFMTRTAAAIVSLVVVSACSPMVHVTTEPEPTTGAAAPDQLRVNSRVRTEAMEVALSNLGDAPIDVLWSGASLVDTQGNSSPVVHSAIGTQWTPPDVSGDVSRIPPHATLEVFLIPDRSVIFERNGAGWYAEPLLPVECGPLRCIGYHELVGKTVRLTLPYRINGADQTFDSTLRITEAFKSMRGGRPSEPALQ